MAEKEEKKRQEPPTIKPDWKDYVAITIAALETTLLPFVLLLLVLLAFVFIISLLVR
jgi:hypothetical protein